MIMSSQKETKPMPPHFSTSSSVYSQYDNEAAFQSKEHIIEEEEEDKYSISSSDQSNYDYKTPLESSTNPSFASINRSLLKQDSGSSETPKIELTGSYEDDDQTPKLPQISSYKDPIDEVTPILETQQIFQSQSSNNLEISYLPQRSLNKKFKRLSTTLQSSNKASSNDSQKFINTFNDNIRSSFNAQTSRGGSYYDKINQSVTSSDTDDPADYEDAELEDEKEKSVVRDESDASTISNRSSIISNGSFHSSPDSVSNDFNFNSTNQTVISQSSYNIGSHKIVPLKVVKNQSIPIGMDQIPPRGDLIEKAKKERLQNLRLQQDDQQALPEEKDSAGLNISYGDLTTDSNLLNKSKDTSFNVDNEDEDLSTLFVRALHPFDSSTLQSEADASICLAFEKDDLAVVHTIDESGWGEVTLIETLARGWVPMNYFKFAIDDPSDDYDDSDEMEEYLDEGRIPNNHFLKPLFQASGKYLINPLSHKTKRGRFTFSIKVMNSVRDGVRELLQETDCLSRSNEIVTKRPVVRKARKIMLADWYNLMIKAKEFQGTSNYNKIEILTLMVYQVIRRAISFLQVWSIESKEIIKKENEKKLQNDMDNYPLLEKPPLAKQRVTEINGILYSYLGLIIGRLDLIEHNPTGCDLLETLTHQMILLLRELLFISKTGSDASNKKPDDLDKSLDSLLSLVSDLVTAVKSLVVKTLNESYDDQRYHIASPSLKNIAEGDTTQYFYTIEGGELIQITSKMIKAISTTVASIRKLLEITGNFQLNSQRAYPDYSIIRIEPETFIRKCSLGIAKSNTIRNRQLRSMKPTVRSSSNRFSVMRSGATGNLGLTSSGAGLLHDVLLSDIDGTFSNDKEFEQYTIEGSTPEDIKMENELLVDASGNLLGASFKGLVYTLTNENSPPEYFFVSTFFICFRTFASGVDLIEELISRFDVTNMFLTNPQNQGVVNLEIKLKNRRRLISKMFQMWMESYWNVGTDYSLLPTLINFFNEGMSHYLPLDSMKLLEVAARLSSKPVTEEHKHRKLKQGKQLISRSITVTRLNRKNSSFANEQNMIQRYSMVDGYELSKINTSSSTSSIKSLTIPLPLGIGSQTSSSSSLLSRSNVSTIEKLILTYRAIIGNGWCPNNYINPKDFISLDIPTLLPNWANICDQSWVLSNYRPNLVDFNGLELAKQLTVIESAIFCSIKPEELLNENYTSKRAHLKLAPNVRQSLLFTNLLSGYVIESVLQPKISSKMRLNIIKTWLKVAISCLYLRNFNSLAAIITSLQSHLITRITKLWDELSDKYQELYDYLSGIIHPDKNYRVYRAKLRNFLVLNDYNIPTVPYFPLFLQDLTFINEGNAKYRKANDFLNKKLINIDKYLKITRIIADIESLQISYINANGESNPNIGSLEENDGNDYSIVSVPSLQELVLLELWKIGQLYKKEEDRSWKLSCVIQPRDAN